jgi:hypothetical protein
MRRRSVRCAASGRLRELLVDRAARVQPDEVVVERVGERHRALARQRVPARHDERQLVGVVRQRSMPVGRGATTPMPTSASFSRTPSPPPADALLQVHVDLRVAREEGAISRGRNCVIAEMLATMRTCPRVPPDQSRIWRGDVVQVGQQPPRQVRQREAAGRACTPLLVRVSSVVRSADSSSLMRLLTAAGAMWPSSAAAAIEPCRTTLTNSLGETGSRRMGGADGSETAAYAWLLRLDPSGRALRVKDQRDACTRSKPGIPHPSVTAPNTAADTRDAVRAMQ